MHKHNTKQERTIVQNETSVDTLSLSHLFDNVVQCRFFGCRFLGYFIPIKDELLSFLELIIVLL